MLIQLSTTWIGPLISLVLVSGPVCLIQRSKQEFETWIRGRRKTPIIQGETWWFQTISRIYLSDIGYRLSAMKSFIKGISYELEFFLQGRIRPFLSQGSSSFSKTHAPITSEDHSFFHSLTKRSQVRCWPIICPGPSRWSGNRLTDASGQNLEIFFGIALWEASSPQILKLWGESNRRFYGKQAHLN